ncbi:unnamed protein product [Phytophthora fragariaefolia]|uniref:Unnamed protein product n=1 Tax=Phytophthora fragariaefolia TaxID=1490495 RepID=A0A9W6UCA8_9STRA|nr:unnamed protein product [Phytophthora fragariaefolia]
MFSFERAVASVCDHRKRFISFDVRPGSWSDAKIFQHSSFGRNTACILPRGHHVIADSGYGVSPTVITPYCENDEGGKLTALQANFNFYLSSTRMAIEGAFGLLKERFRILKKPLEERTPSASVRIIVACMVLHNLLIDFQDTAPVSVGLVNAEDETEEEVREVQRRYTRDQKLRTKLGQQKRDDIAKMFAR